MVPNALLSATKIEARNSIRESLTVLKISRASFYDRAKKGLIRISKDGRRSFVSGAELMRYLGACESTHSNTNP